MVLALACSALTAGGCNPFSCPTAEEMVSLDQPVSVDGGGATDAGDAGASGDGGIDDAAARCLASADDCAAFCRERVGVYLDACKRVTTDAGYAVLIRYYTPCA